MIEQKVLTWDSQDPEYALTLPSRYFYDPEIYKQEIDRIFTSAWHCVCHDSEIAEPGDYVKFDILEQSVLVVHGEDGKVHALHNVCRHRGTELVQARRGRLSSMITCPYHAWSYHLDGRLRHAPRCETLAGFDNKDWGLVPVRLERYANFWFINFDADAPPAAVQFEGAEEAMRPYFPDLDDLRFVEEVDMYVDANWKVIVDNQIEGYHFKLSGPHHKELASLIDFDGYTLTPNNKWWEFKGPPRNVTSAFGHKVQGEKYQTDWFYNLQLWPTTTFYAFPYADAIGSFNQIPLGPEKTLLRFGHYVPKSRPQSALSKASIAWFNEKLGPEDIGLNLYVQRGLKSMAFDQGRYMIDAERGPNSEHLLHHFHKLIYEALNR